MGEIQTHGFAESQYEKTIGLCLVCIPDPVKSTIKEKLASYLGLIADAKLRNEFDLCIEAVSKHEFPANFPALVSYLI